MGCGQRSFSSPLFAIGRQFDLSGTPSGILIDGGGSNRLASGGWLGAAMLLARGTRPLAFVVTAKRRAKSSNPACHGRLDRDSHGLGRR